MSDGRPSQSSSAYSASDQSKNAFDGNMAEYPIFHSANEKFPWLTVDLEASFNITYITIFNRLGNYANRLTDLELQASTKNSFFETDFQICATFPGYFHDSRSFQCEKGTKGQYVRIILGREVNKILNIREMQVYGFK